MYVDDDLKVEYDGIVNDLQELVTELQNVDLSDSADIASMISNLDTKDGMIASLQDSLNAILDAAEEQEAMEEEEEVEEEDPEFGTKLGD